MSSLVTRYLSVEPGMVRAELSEAVEEVLQGDGGLRLVSEMIERSNDDGTIAYIAAGPLEDLFRFHGVDVAGELEILARRSTKWRKALAGVWLTAGDEAEPWLRSVVTRFSQPPR